MEKRPLGIIGAIFFITMVVLSRFGFEKSFYILPVFLIAVFLIFLKQNKIRFFAILTSAVLCACIVFHITDTNFRTKEEYFSGKEVSVEGVLYERPYFNGENYILHIETDKVNSQDVTMKIKVKSLTLPEKATLYNKVKLKANLVKTDSLDNDVKSAYRAQKIVLTGSCVKNTLEAFENNSKPLKYYLLSYKYKMVDLIINYLPNDIGAFISGITFGEKDLMSKETLYNFRVTGASHILVVSGLHVAMWSGILYMFLRKFLSEKYTSVISILFLILFMVFTGFTPSVVRAGIMMILNYTAKIFGEKPDSLNTLGLSALVLTLFDPFSVFGAGTVFSFASVLGILLMNEYIKEKVRNIVSFIKPNLIRKLVYNTVSIVLVSLSAQIFTYPVAVLYNFDFSFLSVVTNFFVSIFTSISMVGGGIGVFLLSAAPNFILSKIIFSCSIISSNIILYIVDRLSVYENLYRNVTTIENYMFLMLVAFVLFLLVFTKLSPKKKTVVFASFLVPIVLVSNFAVAVYKDVYVEFAVIDVGDGLCVTFTNNGETVMLGCGGNNYSVNRITDYFSVREVNKIKALYLPVDKNAKLVNNARVISENFDVESVVTSGEYKFSFVSDNTTSADAITADYFLGKLKIDYFTEKNCSYALATIGKTRILINFYGSLKEESLPYSCINPDIYVTMYSSAYKTDFSATEQYIVSSEFMFYVPATAKNVHFTKNDSTYIKAIKY